MVSKRQDICHFQINIEPLTNFQCDTACHERMSTKEEEITLTIGLCRKMSIPNVNQHTFHLVFQQVDSGPNMLGEVICFYLIFRWLSKGIVSIGRNMGYRHNWAVFLSDSFSIYAHPMYHW